ncbi:Uncharacterised protein [uncultured archaeon]|nr:Uncharacterised protein [uncultured archaeon]
MYTTIEQKRAARLARKRKAEQEYKEWLANQADGATTKEQSKAERFKAKKPLPPAESEGKYEVRFAQLLTEIMTGKPTNAKPQLIKMPETVYEPIALVLSSTEQFYYRTTPNHCPCEGWFYSVERFGKGKCRHHTLAYPEQAARNATEIERIKAEKKEAGRVREKTKALASPIDAIKAALQERGLKVSGVRANACDSVTIRIPFRDTPTAEDERQEDLILQTARRAAPGARIVVSAM